MKKFLFSLALLSSMSAFSTTNITNLVQLSLKYDLGTTVKDSFLSSLDMQVLDVKYSDDLEALNVYFDDRGCYRVSMEEKSIAGQETLVVAKYLRDIRCDKASSRGFFF